MVLMGKEAIIFVNTFFHSSYKMTLGPFGNVPPICAGPWIPIIPSPEQGQDLNGEWQEGDDD
jgi:hypothetical protein